jgi:hypothetical protein
MRLTNVLIGGIFFILILLYVEHTRQTSKEGFTPMVWQQYYEMIRNLQQAQGLLGESKTYDDWVGHLYKNPEDATLVLNDFKSRVFQDSCKFRDDWAYNIPSGMMRPIAPKDATLANTAYRSFMQCVANRNQACIDKLNDARRRFMDSNCGFKNQTDFKAYSRNIPTVFK